MRYLLPFAVMSLLLASCSAPPRQPQRFASVIGLKDDKAEEYKRLHQAVWPGVMKAVRDANIRNYSIYPHRLPDGKLHLFSYLEYAGADHKADIAKLACNPNVKEWCTLTDPYQHPLAGRRPCDWRASLHVVSHQD